MNAHLLNQAAALHRQGQAAEAERLCLQVAAAEPRNPSARYLLAVIALQQGRPADALKAIDRVLAIKPDHLEALASRAVALGQLGRLEEALKAYDRALVRQAGHGVLLYNRGVVLSDLKRHAAALDSFDRALAAAPDLAPAWNNRGFTLQQLKRPADALDSFDRALALDPQSAETWVNRGVALRHLERPEEALESFARAIAIDPDFAPAWSNRGLVEQHLGRLDAAQDSVRRALALSPEDSETLVNLGSVLVESGRTEEGFAAFARHAELVYGAPSAGRAPSPSPPHKRRHDREQRDYIASVGGQRGPAGDLPFQRADGARLPCPAVNPKAATAEVETRWRTSRPQIVVIDDLLTPEALERLRRFCWGSTIWRSAYGDGYLGAMAEQGLASPLMAQIADELREVFPAILGEHPLTYLWAFKYDSRLKGINVHADRAAVNVNFWITPDEANLDPKGGGLVVWDAAAPLDWDYERYNTDPAANREFLAASGAGKVTIPYRANRAVIFDSDLFHETDAIAFKEGYCNRRINVTMLYGRRSSDNR